MNFANNLKKWFRKSNQEQETYLPNDEKAEFFLVADQVVIATLRCEKGKWIFKYTEEFKGKIDKYNHITGFSDLNKTYISETLWPFFQIRIPGLNQPAVKEILANEKIEKENEVALLKRFGRATISNPYLLLPA